MSLSYKGVGDKCLTFIKGSALTVQGNLVTVSANSTVAPSASGEAFAGIVKSVNDGFVSVQVGGYLELTYDGTAPSFGRIFLQASTSPTVVKSATSGVRVLVVKVDTANSTVGFIF